MTGDLIESGELHTGIAVRLAGTGTGALHDALACANSIGLDRARSLVEAWLPDTPHDGRRRTEVAPQVGRSGAAFADLVDADVILRALDGLDADPSNMNLVTLDDGVRTKNPTSEYGFTRPQTDAPGRINGAAIAAQLRKDGLLNLPGIDRSVPALADLAEAAERCTGAAVHISAFITGRTGVSVGMHNDDGETWAVQLEGSKRWTIREANVRWFDRSRSPTMPEAGELLLDTCIEPGDTLVVPKGAMHDVCATDDFTVALSILVASHSRASLLEAHLRAVGTDSDWLEPLHWVEPDAWPDGEKAPTAADLAGTLAAFRASRTARTTGGAAFWWLRATEDSFRETQFRSTCGGGAHVVEDIGRFNTVVVALGGRVLRLRRRCLDLLPTLFSGVPFALADLNWSGSFDDTVELVTALGAEGVVSPLGPVDAPSR